MKKVILSIIFLCVLLLITSCIKWGVKSIPTEINPICNLPTGITCIEYKVTSDTKTVELTLRNDLPFDMRDIVVATSSCRETGPTTLARGEQKIFTLKDCSELKKGSIYSTRIDLTYETSDRGIIAKPFGRLEVSVK